MSTSPNLNLITPSVPDRAEIERFVTALVGGLDQPLHWRAIHDTNKSKGGRKLFGTLDEKYDELTRLQGDGYGIFAVVNEGGESDGAIQRIRASFVDHDRGHKDQNQSPVTFETFIAAGLEPSMAVQTRNGQHCYFWVAEEDAGQLDRWKQVQEALIAKFNTDRTIKNPSRVLRVPGTWHLKDPNDPFLVRIIHMADDQDGNTFDGIVLALSLDVSAAGRRAAKRSQAPSPTPAPSGSAEPDAVFLQAAREHAAQKPEGHQSMFAEKPAPAATLEERKRRAAKYINNMGPATEGEGGDAHALKVANVCVDFDLPDDHALEVLRSWNETCRPPWTDAELATKLDNARKYRQSEPGSKVRAIESSASEPMMAESQAAKIHRLLGTHTKELTGHEGPIRLNLRSGQIHIGATPLTTDEIVPIVLRNVGRVEVSVNKAGVLVAPNWSESMVRSQLISLALAHPYDPVVEELDGLPEWDRADHVPELLAALNLKSEHPLYLTFLRLMLRSAVARARRPGCKVDTMTILHDDVGGRGKSRFFAHLFGEQFFADAAFQIDNKDSLMLLNTAWVHEWGEMQQLRSAKSREALKAFLSRSTDRYRPPYGHDVGVYPRRSIFLGSTNSKMLFENDGGNRRFCLIPDVGTIDLDAVDRLRLSLWAQADAEVAAGERWWLDDADEAAHAEQQEAHIFEDVGIGSLAKWLERKNETGVDEIMTSGPDYFRSSAFRTGQSGIARILKTLGFEARNLRRDGTRRRTWVRLVPVGPSGLFESVAKVLPFTTLHPEAHRGDA